MYERFTEGTRKAVRLAQEEARCFDHDHVGTGHILVGLLGGGKDDTAAEALHGFGVTMDAVRGRLGDKVGHDWQEGGRSSGRLRFTPRAKIALEISLREALNLGDGRVGTKHILLGLLREGQGSATHLLRDLGVESRTVRRELLRKEDAGRPT